MSEQTDIKSLSADELIAALEELGQPKFRANQVRDWLYRKFVRSFDEMTDLSKGLRKELSEHYTLNVPEIAKKQVSKDGTRKYLLSLDETTYVETVGIPSQNGKRLTVCVSSQAGCPMGCTFCATGNGGFNRNLSINEIINQLQIVSEDFGQRVSNLVVMGQGEPFLNYNNVLAALKIINNEKSLNIGARHITVSTCGIAKGIQKFALEPYQFTLAISLHSAIQSTRDKLMPGTSSTPLNELRDILLDYIKKTGRRPTFEYAMIKGVNDTDEQLKALIDFCSGMLCHVNLISLNPVSNSKESWMMEPSGRRTHLMRELNRRGIEASERISKGSDIDGACGQLAQKAI